MLASNFSFFPVTSDAYWEIALENISIGSELLNVCDNLNHASGNCGIAIDTGTSLFAGPTN